VYWGKDSRALWSSGFFLCSVGGDTLEILKQYIENRAANRALDHLPTVNGGIA
jgi:REP element-mobilizing transposase RayT